MLGIIGALFASGIAGAQVAQSPAILVNKLSSRYRSIQTYSDTANWKIKIGDREILANISLAVARPNKYALEIKGDKLNTLIWSDGNFLSGYRPDRKALARTKAPLRLIGADVLSGVHIQMLGVRMVTLLLEGNLREGDSEITAALNQAKLSPPQAFGNKLAYVLSFPWDADYEARVYIGSDDLLIRRVTLLKGGSIEWVENHESIQVDQPIPNETFNRPTPEGALTVASLPPIEKLRSDSAGAPAPDFSIDTLSGGTVRLSELKGKVVLINFYSLQDETIDQGFPHLVQVYKEFKDKGIEFISINDGKDPPDSINEFFKMKQATHVSALNNPDDVAKLFKVMEGSQTSIVIDREGNAVARFTGYSLQRIRSALQKAGIE